VIHGPHHLTLAATPYDFERLEPAREQLVRSPSSQYRVARITYETPQARALSSLDAEDHSVIVDV